MASKKKKEKKTTFEIFFSSLHGYIYVLGKKKKLFVDTYDYESLSVGSFWWRGIFL
jgi:hypothetical protein